MTPQTKLRNAKIGLLFREPFWATLLCNLKAIETKAVPTMATDGVRLLWNPDFVHELSDGALRTVLCHEVMHCALLHPVRRGNRDPFLWNLAIDHAVNLVLEQCNEDAKAKGRHIPFEWPEPECYVLKDPKYKGMSGEEIYAQFPKQQPQQQGGGPSGKGKKGGQQGQQPPGKSMGDVTDPPGGQSERNEIESQWKINLVQAAEAARMQGKLPAEIARMVDELINPRTPWQEILRRFISAKAKDDYSWAHPNRRYAHTGFMLPSLYSQRLGKIVVVVDTSGSIDEQLLNVFLSEIESICHETRPEKIVLIDCDAKVHSVREYEPTDTLPRDYEGGGGTSFVPALEEAEKHDAQCVVYLTDGYGELDSEKSVQYGAPVIWALTGDHPDMPFGETIRIKGCD